MVALVADGLTNRGVAAELGLSEHTIKKYMLRIFDKVGISSRVELVLYAMSHSENRPSEWMPSGNLTVAAGHQSCSKIFTAEENAAGYNGSMQSGEEIGASQLPRSSPIPLPLPVPESRADGP